MGSVHRCNKTKISKIQTAQIDDWKNRWRNNISILYFFSYMSVYSVMILSELYPPILALYVNVFIKSDSISVKLGGP